MQPNNDGVNPNEEQVVTPPVESPTTEPAATPEAKPLTDADVDPSLQDSDFDEAFDDPNNLQELLADTGEEESDEEDQDAPAADQPATPPEAQPAAEAPKPGTKAAREQEVNQDIAALKQELGLEPNADIRALVAERNTLRELRDAQKEQSELSLERRILDMVNPETGEYYSPAEAQRIARQAALEVSTSEAATRAYDLQVGSNQRVISSEIDKAKSEFPVFIETLPDGTPNPQYDPDLANIAGEQLLDSYIIQNVPQVVDGKQTTVPVVVGIKRSPYQIMQKIAASAERYKTLAQGKAAEALEDEAANADLPAHGSTTPPQRGATDDFDDTFDSYDD